MIMWYGATRRELKLVAHTRANLGANACLVARTKRPRRQGITAVQERIRKWKAKANKYWQRESGKDLDAVYTEHLLNHAQRYLLVHRMVLHL